MHLNTLGYIVIFFILVICIKTYFESDHYNLTCIDSNVDGKEYCVRPRPKQELAADLLANTTLKMKKLVKHMQNNYIINDNVQRLIKNFNPQSIVETLPNSEHTAYSENKGEKIAFCLNTTKDGDKLIDQNTLMFVSIHELAHTMTESVGHTDEFWNNFKFLLENASKINIYRPVDYSKHPTSYCGMTINENPLFSKLH